MTEDFNNPVVQFLLVLGIPALAIGAGMLGFMLGIMNGGNSTVEEEEDPEEVRREERNARRRERYHERRMAEQQQESEKSCETRVAEIENNPRLTNEMKQKQINWLRNG